MLNFRMEINTLIKRQNRLIVFNSRNTLPVLESRLCLPINKRL